MTRIEKVHLYVEKYDRTRQELLLDFVKEDEFIYFKYHGDYTVNMHLSADEYEPTMLLIHGCAPKKTLHHGSVLILNMDSLMKMNNERDSNSNQYSFDRPATVFLEIQDGEYLAELIDDSDNSSVAMYIPKEFFFHLESSWIGNPCALNYLEEVFEVSVWDVGQGNTNCISDERNLTIFDFGSSFYYSQKKQNMILEAHWDFIKKHERVSLIISHWDIDHYNLLCAVPDTFLQNICCVFYPSLGIGLTMIQVAEKIKRNCNYRNAINAPQKASRNCGIVKVFEGNNYALFTGENSNNKNHSGLMLSVFNNNATAFLTADHSNYQIWDRLCASINTTINPLHVVIPHHGGHCGNTPIPHGIHPGVAAISVGSNMYGHPKSKTISAYRKAGFNLIRTDWYGQDIVIKM